MRKFDKNYRNVRNKIIIAILFLFLSCIIVEQAKTTDALIKRTNQQTTKMQELEQEVRDANTANARLENVIVYQYQQIKETSNQPKVEYITVNENIIEEDTKSLNPIKMPHPSTIVVAILGTLSGVVKVLTPSF